MGIAGEGRGNNGGVSIHAFGSACGVADAPREEDSTGEGKGKEVDGGKVEKGAEPKEEAAGR